MFFMVGLCLIIPPGLGISKDALFAKAKKYGHNTQEMQLRFSLIYIEELKKLEQPTTNITSIRSYIPI